MRLLFARVGVRAGILPSVMWTSRGPRSRQLSSREELQEDRENMQTYTNRISYIYLLLARHRTSPTPTPWSL